MTLVGRVKLLVIRPRGYKTFCMLNSTEQKIPLLIKTKMPTNEEVFCSKSLRCCIDHANKY